MNENKPNVTTKLVAEYAAGYDHTFIMEETYVDGECVAQECVGWYWGSPDDEATKQFANCKLKATY